MEQQTGSNLGKEYVKAIHCHLAYLTYMQRTVVLEKTLERPLDCKDIKPSLLKKISAEYSLEGLM